jgi:tripartite-type tricarboxylate transporter receptor subunit TctC
VKELIALAKARPGEIDYAAGGYGGNSHLVMAHFLTMAGVNMTFVPYKSGNAGLVDGLAGRVPVIAGNVLVQLPHVRGGRLRAFGITSAKRASAAPDIPPIAETVPGYEATQWFGILAPAGTPQDIVARLHRELAQVLQEEDTRAHFIKGGGEPAFSRSPEEFAAFVRAEVAKWAKVVKAAKIEPQ